MMRFRVLILMILTGPFCFPQNMEREHRITKSQFPSMQSDLKLDDFNIRKVRYYKEVDTLETTYIQKFKLDRLDYFISFDETGKLKYSGLRVQEIDVPEDTFKKMEVFLSEAFEKYRIKRIFQMYPSSNTEITGSELKNTFQNLLLPSNVYKMIVIGKNDNKNLEFDFWFHADGMFIRKRKALPMNHDRILY